MIRSDQSWPIITLQASILGGPVPALVHQRLRRFTAVVAPLSGAVLMLAACGGASTPAATTVTVAAVTVTASASPTVSATDSSSSGAVPANASDTSSTAPATETSGDGADGVPTASNTARVIGAVTTPRKLTLADVFSSQSWKEGSITVPKASAPLQGIYAPTGSCSSTTRLELRFADQKGQLRITGAQALDSASSSVVLEYRLLADGRLVDTKVVRFSERQTVKAELTGVSSVILEVRRVQVEGSSCATTAVLTDVSIIPPA